MRVYYQEGTRPIERGTEQSAGLDLRVKEPALVVNHRVTMVGTGVHVEIPEGYFGMVVVRSSMAKRGLQIANQVGIIDSDYRGEIMLPLICTVGQEYLHLPAEERVAQLIILPCWMGSVEAVGSLDALSTSSRGENGFGSTGSF